MALLNLLGRALHLLVLVIYPKAGSPEPIASGAAIGVIAALLLLGAPVMSALVWRRLRTLEALAAAIGWTAASVALIACASTFSGARAPLLRGYYVAAPLVWISLALTAASIAGYYLGSSWKGRKALGAILVLVPGIFIFMQTHEYIASTPEMWKRAALEDPGNETAIANGQPDPRTLDRVADLAGPLDACVKSNPTSCVCLTRRAAVRSRQGDVSGAIEDVRAAESAKCDVDAGPVRLREVAVAVFALSATPEEIASRVEGAKDRSTNAVFLYGDAVLAMLRGDAAEALRLAGAASDAGGDKDAKLLYVQLLMIAGKNADARPVLEQILQKDPSDANALYDLALIEDLGGNFNKAREGYLATLKVDPKQKNARYNLAMLTLKRGIAAEAKHHAETFVKDYPDDPRGETLLRITGAK